jgi:hypothetical protein
MTQQSENLMKKVSFSMEERDASPHMNNYPKHTTDFKNNQENASMSGFP